MLPRRLVRRVLPPRHVECSGDEGCDHHDRRRGERYLTDIPGDVTVAYSFAHDYGPTLFSADSQVYMTTLGANLQVGQTWQATLSESYGRQSLQSNEYATSDPNTLTAYLADPSPATAFNPFGATNPQTLAAIERDFPLHAVSTIEYTNLVADGSVFSSRAAMPNSPLAWSGGRRDCFTASPIR